MPGFLIQTVGGTPEPLSASLSHHRPERIVFVVSKESRASVTSTVLPRAGECGFTIGSGAWEHLLLSNEEDLECCVDEIQRLGSQVLGWRSRGDDHEVIVDITGGTKIMSAAAAIASLPWPCTYSYVGGKVRDKGGVGIVVSGSERILSQPDPARLRSFLARDRFAQLFNSGDFSGAQSVAEEMRNAATGGLKTEWTAFCTLAEGYASWDRFQYREARSKIDGALKYESQIERLVGANERPHLIAVLKSHIERLDDLKHEPCEALLSDLLANARRCAARERWDDATARLYRAVELGAQILLLEAYSIKTSDVQLDILPEAMRSDPDLVAAKRGESSKIKWDLQKDYRALRLLDDPLALRFVALELDSDDPNRHSPLSARNNSLLAHGFEPVSKGSFDRLWDPTLKLLEVDEASLVRFPRLPSF